MAQINELLNQVWAAFRKAGITDDFVIINHVAAILLDMEGFSDLYTDKLPSLPKETSELSLNEIEYSLVPAVNLAQGAGSLFDRYVLFRLPEMLKGGRYITPRHIVHFMLSLANLSDSHSLADIACGSGGFLVHAGASMEQRLGIEISPEWAQIARANLLLNHQSNTEILTGNSLRLVESSYKLGEDSFDRIVMNPPFGERVQPHRISPSSRSETALNTLAIQKLNDDGRAALLVPTGILFSNNKGESGLREIMVNNYHLEAVISLPLDAFQPYSSIPTHLLLVQKTTVPDTALTWFLRPEFDGYREGRGRDLTKDPEKPNDLIFTEHVIELARSNNQVEDDGHPVKIDVISENGTRLGFFVQPANNVIINHARFLPALENNSALILFQVQQEDAQEYWAFAPDDGEFDNIQDDVEDLIRDRLDLKKSAPIPRPDIFQNRGVASDGQSLTAGETLGERLVITADGQLFGVAVSRRVIQERYYSLEPDRYVRAPEVEIERRPPHEILQDIQSNQRELSNRIYQLLGWVSPEPAPEISLPSPILTEGEGAITPFGMLSAEQSAVWDLVKAQAESIEGKERSTGKYFTAQTILDQSDETFTEESVELTLEILAGMGVIIPVSQPNPIDSESPSMSFYRLIEERDVWQLDQLPEEGEE